MTACPGLGRTGLPPTGGTGSIGRAAARRFDARRGAYRRVGRRRAGADGVAEGAAAYPAHAAMRTMSVMSPPRRAIVDRASMTRETKTSPRRFPPRVGCRRGEGIVDRPSRVVASVRGVARRGRPCCLHHPRRPHLEDPIHAATHPPRRRSALPRPARCRRGTSAPWPDPASRLCRLRTIDGPATRQAALGRVARGLGR